MWVKTFSNKSSWNGWTSTLRGTDETSSDSFVKFTICKCHLKESIRQDLLCTSFFYAMCFILCVLNYSATAQHDVAKIVNCIYLQAIDIFNIESAKKCAANEHGKELKPAKNSECSNSIHGIRTSYPGRCSTGRRRSRPSCRRWWTARTGRRTRTCCRCLHPRRSRSHASCRKLVYFELTSIKQPTAQLQELVVTGIDPEASR